MSSGSPEKSQWKFDPNTGEPIAYDQQADEPSEQPFRQFSQARAPITGPLGPAPDLPVEDVDTFRAPFQAQEPTPPHHSAEQPQQATYQPPTASFAGTPPQGYTAPAPPAPPFEYGASQAPTQPYSYSAQPPTQPTPAYPPQYNQAGDYGQSAAQVPAITTQTEPSRPPRPRSRAPLIAGILAVILLIVIAGVALYLWQNVFGRPAVAVERLLPANTLGYFSFDPVLEGQQKAAMDRIGEAFQSQPGFKEAWDKITGQVTSALGDNGSGNNSGNNSQYGATPTAGSLDTLATYLGNSVTLAVLAPSSDDLQRIQDAANNGDMESVAGDVISKNVVGIVDLDFNPLNKKGPISDLKQQADNIGKAELVETYRDVDIHKFITNTNEIFFALLDGSSTAIVGAKVDPLKVLIDDFRDNKTLKDDETFKALSGQVPQDRIAALYMNLTEIYKQAQLADPEVMEQQTVQNVSGSMLFTLSATDDGLQLDVASETDLSLMGTSLQVNPDARPDESILNDVPSGALAFFAGTDLKTILEGVLKNLRDNNDVGNEIDEQIKSIEDATKVNIEQDLLPLLGGDYALSVSLNGQGEQASPSVIFELKLSEPDKMKSMLDKALSPQSNPDANATEVQLAGETFYGDPNSGVLLGVAQDRFWFIFDTNGQAAHADLQATIDNVGKGFGTSSQWNSAKAHLARDSNAIAYVDLTGLREYLESDFLDTMGDETKSDYDQTVAPFVRPLKYLLVGSATQSAKSGQLSRNHTVLFLGISK